ncbi:hypothetical protein EJ04DRAFT_581117 [Polyplosphaeria fusca]|uniref:Uncharacterized protein n=1 Tax=Polyplosphaeria fusca TaxID=682080 RepID=A0A9P4QN84_9PLEO|nr:hypothetical protein EJ04DRAFT_581117 [Polyplosphaeria fusca]
MRFLTPLLTLTALALSTPIIPTPNLHPTTTTLDLTLEENLALHNLSASAPKDNCGYYKFPLNPTSTYWFPANEDICVNWPGTPSEFKVWGGCICFWFVNHSCMRSQYFGQADGPVHGSLIGTYVYSAQCYHG